MAYSVDVLADSIGPHGVRITTVCVVFPRFLLSEINTHRALSRNSASSRAIPTEKQIQRVIDNPFIPEFNLRVKGMGVGEPLSADEQAMAVDTWVKAKDAAVAASQALLHVDKSRVNRLLEPFLWHTAIISATEWDNFLNLRDHPEAQPELQKLAKLIRQERDASSPQEMEYGDWHLPLWFPSDELARRNALLDPAKVCAGRCARVSYDTHNVIEDPWDSQERWERLAPSGHWSPGEHPAQCVRGGSGLGNFTGWKQLRKFYPNEDVFCATLDA